MCACVQILSIHVNGQSSGKQQSQRLIYSTGNLSIIDQSRGLLGPTGRPHPLYKANSAITIKQIFLTPVAVSLAEPQSASAFISNSRS